MKQIDRRFLFVSVFLILLLALFFIPDGQGLTINLTKKFSPPEKGSLFGRDQFGRNMLSLLINAARRSLLLATTLSAAVIICCLLSVYCALLSFWWKKVLETLSNFLFAFPPLVAILVLTVLLGSESWLFCLFIIAAFWSFNFRLFLTEAEVMQNELFVLQAKCFGCSKWVIFKEHILPFLMITANVRFVLTAAEIIIVENSFHFLGVIAGSCQPSLGNLLNTGWNNYFLAPWIFWSSALTFFLLLLFLFALAGYFQKTSANWF